MKGKNAGKKQGKCGSKVKKKAETVQYDEEYSRAEEEFEKALSMQQKAKPRIFFENGVLKAKDNDSISVLKEGFYGRLSAKELIILPLEAMYLSNMRNIPCVSRDETLGFTGLSRIFAKEPRIFARYNIFRDWRDRGIILDFPERMEMQNFGRSPIVKYPSRTVEIPKAEKELLYFSEDMVSITDYDSTLKSFFEDMWFGQLGVYKQHHRDNVLKLDFIETIFLSKKGFSVRDIRQDRTVSTDKLLETIVTKRPDAKALLDVYDDWRSRGYILKTGFKFGTHFRLYFPGASPVRGKSDWLHSKHVIHVFPKEARMIMSEWARAVRVAHSVRKTFIMAIPGMEEKDYTGGRALIDFIGYHRKRQGIEKPEEDKPKFAVVAFTEDEEFGAREMAAALKEADTLGLRLIIAISDRETAVTYYVAKRIELPGSRNTYYEIEWEQP